MVGQKRRWLLVRKNGLEKKTESTIQGSEPGFRALGKDKKIETMISLVCSPSEGGNTSD